MKRSFLIRELMPAIVAAVAMGTVAHAHHHKPTQNWLAQTSPKPASKTVKIQAFQYKPAKITVKKGESVTFTNLDSTPHTVTPEGSAKFKASGRLKRNESVTITFDTVGEQTYFCDIHPSMKGVVMVTP